MRRSPLEEHALHAGATTTDRGGIRVAAHYGSSAGELAACLRAVGLGDRGDLQIFALNGPPAVVQDVIEGAAGLTLAVGGVVRFRGARWCGAGIGRVLVIVDPCLSEQPLDAISLRVRLRANVTVTDVSDEWTAIAAVGARCEQLLARIGLGTSESESRPPFARVTIAGAQAFLLRDSLCQALILARPRAAPEIWRELELDGHDLDLSIVGIEALERFALHERLIDQAALHRTPVPAYH
jgi:glycine cleavage system aminomethyltransferase T